MIEYRKNSARMLYRINGTEVTEVLNKMAVASIRFQDNAAFAEEVLVEFRPCTEAEFKYAWTLAKDRILTEKL